MPKRDELKDFKERLERCDKNEDKEITLIEATADMCYMTSETFLQYSSSHEKNFRIDTVTHAPKEDKDERINHQFKQCDSNNDQQLTLVEATSLRCRHISSDTFIRLNTDKNKYLTKRELSKMYDESVEPRRMPFRIMKEMPPEAQIQIAFGECDEDKNRKMSIDEAKACELSMEIFEKFDYDTSNTIEQNDLEMIQKKAEFKMVDMNSNNKIELKEFAERMGNRCRVF